MLTGARPETVTERRPRTGSGLAGLLAVLVVAGVTAVSWLMERPPAPVPASAPATEFSAERAWRHLERIAGTGPTPVGSAAGDDVRDHLVAELTRLGLAPQVQHGTGSVSFGSSVTAGRAENVVATIPGTAPTGRLLLAAHYDSTFSGPGASDDKASVAAILEAARAILAGPRPRNDVVLLLTDAEEPGMVGAAAYVDGPDGRVPGVVLNGEGPGNSGSSMLFQTSPGAAAVVAAFAADAEHPMGSSLFPSLVHLMNSHTDLDVLGAAGYEGLTFGFADGRAYYHSSQDTLANLDRASLQQHGAALLTLARAFGERDLATLFSDVDVTFFTMFGLVVTYPDALAVPLALLAVALVVALGVLARGRGLTTVPRMAAGAAAGLGLLVAVVAAAVGLWELLVWLRPGYGELMIGEPYRPGPYRWALAALTLTLALAWYLLLRRRVGVFGLIVGGALWPALLGLVLAAVVPGTAYFATVPALLVATAGIVATGVGPGRPNLQLAVWTIGIAPSVLVILDAGRIVLQGTGLGMGGAATLCFALAALIALPAIAAVLPDGPRRRRAAFLPVVTAVLSVALVATGLAVDRFDARYPQPTSLRYVLDADTGLARWESSDETPHDWVRAYTPNPATGDPQAAVLPYRAEARWTGPAAAVPFPAPELTVLGVVDGLVRVHVRSPRDADVLVLAADRPVQHVAITADAGPPTAATPSPPVPGRPWPFELQFYDPPAEGITVELHMADAAGLRLSVADYTPSLADLPGFTPRPPELTRSNEHDGDIAVVTRTLRL